MQIHSMLKLNPTTRYDNANNHAQANKFILNPTRITPAVNLISQKQYMIIKGRSCPKDAQDFYAQIHKSLDWYSTLGKDKLIIYFSLEYFDTRSSKHIFDLFKKLQAFNKKGMNITVNWYYEKEDEEMLEFGESYRELFNYRFNIKPFSSKQKTS